MWVSMILSHDDLSHDAVSHGDMSHNKMSHRDARAHEKTIQPFKSAFLRNCATLQKVWWLGRLNMITS